MHWYPELEATLVDVPVLWVRAGWACERPLVGGIRNRPSTLAELARNVEVYIQLQAGGSSIIARLVRTEKLSLCVFLVFVVERVCTWRSPVTTGFSSQF